MEKKLINLFDALPDHLKVDESIKKAAIEVLNSCDYLSKRNFALDIRDCINSSIDLFFYKIQNYKFKEDNSNLIEYNESIKSYISGIMSIVNGSLQADRMFFQVPGFNAVLYDIPSKLIIFYTGFVKQISEILNDLDNGFGFIVCPDLYQITYISILFDQKYTEENLLLKVRVPVKSLFKPNRLLQELTHEVAHFVGKKIRNRKIRYIVETKIIASEITHSLFECNNDIIPLVFNKIKDISDFYKKTCSLLEQYLKIYGDKYIKELSESSLKEFRYHQDYLDKEFSFAVFQVLSNAETLNGILSRIIVSCDSNENFIIKNSLAFKIAIDYNLNNIKKNISKLISNIHKIIKESYADIIMILLLNISLEEYILSFFILAKETNEEPSDILYCNVTGERIVSVFKSLDKSLNDLSFDEFYENNNDKDICKLNRFIEVLKRFADDGPSDKNETVFSKDSLNYIVYYLKECKKLFENSHYDLNYIREVYNKVTSTNIFDCLIGIKDFNYVFRDSMFFTSET